MAGNRRDVDDRTFAALQPAGQRAREEHGREQVDREHLLPKRQIAVQAAEPLARLALGRESGIVDERVQGAIAEQLEQPVDRKLEVLDLRQIGGDMRVTVAAGAFRRHRVARAGDHAPTLVHEVHRCGVADAAAGAGDEHGLVPGTWNRRHGRHPRPADALDIGLAAYPSKARCGAPAERAGASLGSPGRAGLARGAAPPGAGPQAHAGCRRAGRGR
ncbi:MAG: hypothetical protein K0R41_3251 [Geminicoccaceae bacterium]|nr:hypothetical protein [Geminicoccaceae bacterium]